MTKHWSDNGGPAFPHQWTAMDGTPMGVHGMTLRDYFAAAALQGILAGGFADTIPHDDINGGSDAAHYAYTYADAMLKHREKEE